VQYGVNSYILLKSRLLSQGVQLSQPVRGGFKYGDISLFGRERGVSNLRVYNMVMSSTALGPENDCSGEQL
jgi:hypothetical protein